MSEHWDDIYHQSNPTGFSWYESVPATLPLLQKSSTDLSERIVDVGAGASTLVDHLVERGFSDVTLLDLSPKALDEVRRRLGKQAAGVTFVAGDVRTWRPDQVFDLWHDRATFHFMTTPEDIAAYRATLDANLSTNGRAVIAAFSLDGPDHCAGLPVARYDKETLAAQFSDFMTCDECIDKPVEADDTDARPYVVCSFRRSASIGSS